MRSIEILRVLDKKTHILNLSANPCTTPKFVSEYSDAGWYFSYLSTNENFGIDVIKKNLHLGLDYRTLSSNRGISLKTILKHPEINWDYDFLSDNENVPWNFVQDKVPFRSRSGYLSKNPNVTIDIIIENISIIQASISKHPNVTMEIVIENPHMRWYDYDLSQNMNMTWEIIQDTKDKIKWDYNLLSSNPNITPEIVEKNLGIEWNFDLLLSNASTDLNKAKKLLQTYPSIDNSWLLLNPNLDLKYVEENFLFEHKEISDNTFEKNIGLRWVKAKIIQRWYRRWRNRN